MKGDWMGLVDALRRLVNFSSLNKIKRAINGLSEEEWNELSEWMATQIEDEGEPEEEYEDVTFDPKKAGKAQFVRGGWY